MNCQKCDQRIIQTGRGPTPRFCSTRCRVAAHRTTKRILDSSMGGRRWVRADGKRPIQVNGRAASTTNEATWSTYSAVMKSKAGDGYGVMLGDGLGCYDLDNISDENARAFMATIAEPIIYVERSMSGSGVHIF